MFSWNIWNHKGNAATAIKDFEFMRKCETRINKNWTLVVGVWDVELRTTRPQQLAMYYFYNLNANIARSRANNVFLTEFNPFIEKEVFGVGLHEFFF